MDTGPALFTVAEVERQLKDDQVKHFMTLMKDEKVTAGVGDDPNKTYKGQYRMLNGKLTCDGVGVLTWKDGTCYIGQFVNNKMQGKGRMTQANGDVYQGDWKNNMANGIGCLVNHEGGTSEGEWVDDLQNGFGKQSWEFGKIRFSG